VVADPATMVALGPFGEGFVPTAAALAFFGTALAAVLMVKRIPGAILIGIGVVALIGLVVPAGDGRVTPLPEGIVGLPASPGPVYLQVDWFYPFRHWESSWIILLTLLFVDLFDTVGTLIGVSRQAKLVDGNGELPRIRNAFLADAGATTIGACLGSSPVTSYIESATGVEAGGRTGLTGVVVAVCFLLVLFLTPLILAIPPAATAPALILVGVLMMKGVRHLEWDDFSQVVPAILTVVLIPLGFGIANGIALGFIAYVLIAFGSGRGREVHWLLATLAILFVIKFLAVGAG
jgi:AGZA family xanthine/uracil permease-like MFS transporter